MVQLSLALLVSLCVNIFFCVRRRPSLCRGVYQIIHVVLYYRRMLLCFFKDIRAFFTNHPIYSNEGYCCHKGPDRERYALLFLTLMCLRHVHVKWSNTSKFVFQCFQLYLQMTSRVGINCENVPLYLVEARLRMRGIIFMTSIIRSGKKTLTITRSYRRIQSMATSAQTNEVSAGLHSVTFLQK